MTLGWNRRLSTTILNGFRFNVTRWSYNQITSSSQTNFGIPFYNIFDFNSAQGGPNGLPGCCINAGAGRGGTPPAIFSQSKFDFRDTVSKFMGAQRLKFGVDIGKNLNNNNEQGSTRPLFQFSSFIAWPNHAPKSQPIT